MTKLTITRALIELKTIDKRISKNINSSVFVSYEGKFHKPNEKSKSSQSSYQSIIDLIKRRKKLKSLIVSSNANTYVTICDEKMTIAEAIETKSSIERSKKLLNVLKQQYSEAITEVETINYKIRTDLESKTELKNEKDGNIDILDFSKKYMDMHGLELYDPIDIKTKIEELENYIMKFESEVDYVLTEKNSTTFIEI